jgi:hypothetical protein
LLADPTLFVVNPSNLVVRAASYSNASVSYRLVTEGYGEVGLTLSMQNVFNAGPAKTSGYLQEDDVIGRYVNVGLHFTY